MTFSLIGLFGYITTVGVSLILVGVFIRKGTSKTCRKCEFDLVGLTCSICPECGQLLDPKRAIAIGLRRTRLIRIGVALTVFCTLGFGYMLFDSPGMDKHKPLWLLGAELKLLGTPREDRVAVELGRRQSSGLLSKGELTQLYNIIHARLLTLDADTAYYKMHEIGQSNSDIPAEDVQILIDKYLANWTTLGPIRQQQVVLHLRSMLQTYGTTWENMLPIIEEGHRLIDLDAAAPLQQTALQLNDIGLILEEWWISEYSDNELTRDQFLLLFGDHSRNTLQVRPQIEQGSRWIPMRISHNFRGLFNGIPRGLKVHYRADAVRIDGQSLDMRDFSALGMAMGMPGDTRSAQSSGGLSAKALDLELGTHQVELDYRFAVIQGMSSNGKPWAPFHMPDAETVPALIDTTKTYAATFEVVPLGEDPIGLLTPGVDGVPAVNELLKYIRVSDLGYTNLIAPDRFRGPFQLRIGIRPPHLMTFGRAPLVRDPKQDRDLREINAVFSVVASQGEKRWELGYVTWRDMLRKQTGFVQLWPDVASRRNADGSRIPVDEPDLAKPVRIFLTPAPDRAVQSVDITEIIGEPLDLGLFEIKVWTTEDMYSFSLDEDAYQAPPSARKELSD